MGHHSAEFLNRASRRHDCPLDLRIGTSLAKPSI